jgi:cation diffusion facilitator CzcD-associated flavoprotein CzcO
MGTPRIAIIGAGFAGLCLGIQLKKLGLESFTLFEKSQRLGGTWRDNRYPGSACDLPSMAYCFSFEQKTDWSRKWSPQAEILEYMDHCAEKYGLLPHIRFGTEVAGARFDADSGVWRIVTGAGDEIEAEILVSGVGQLHRPYRPAVPGLDRFEGECFHSAEWNHDYDLHGKRVAVIGNAASAIQFIPEIAKQVEQLYVFQRSANWMLPRGDRAFTDAEKRRFSEWPLVAKLYRWFIWGRQELMFPMFIGSERAAKKAMQMALKSMRSVIADPKLQDALVPDYPIGGKRILISDDYYPALERPNVQVVLEGIERFDAKSVITRDGAAFEVDAAILATGFRTNEFLAPMQIEGLDGLSLGMLWADGARAYFGLTVAGFPNFFMMYGPNTNLGHNSIIFMIECQTNYIIRSIQILQREGLKYLNLRPRAMQAFNRKLDAELERTAWARTGKSWYKNEAGQITNNWSGTTARYWWQTRKVDLDAYEQVRR